ncbi:MAG: hypothetical protein EOO78_34710, partial [Oxalobacteraceae bacterium]
MRSARLGLPLLLAVLAQVLAGARHQCDGGAAGVQRLVGLLRQCHRLDHLGAAERLGAAGLAGVCPRA